MQQELIARVAELLFVNGQTTQAVRTSVSRLGAALGVRATCRERWGELTLSFDGVPAAGILAEPLGVDMGRVAATEALVDAVCDKRVPPEAASARLAAIAAHPPVSLARFAIMAAAGAAALGVIFGAAQPLTLALIALSAGAGACLRRGLAGASTNPLVQPLAAALLAGVVGTLAMILKLDVDHRLVVVCPCMVLVPGPHFLNGTIDLARARIPLGAARIAFATLIVLMIITGLLMGLSLGGGTIPAGGAAPAVPLGYDVLAAGVAVAAYGSFFNMPWRVLPLPIVVGMLAHAAHWGMLQAGASVQSAAFVACLIVGLIVTPLADRLRMPYGAFAFAPVVSLIPGVFMFQAASALLALVSADRTAQAGVLTEAVADGTTAFVIILAMTFGLIVPKMCIEHAQVRRGSPRP
ncbi:threonine/serine exporter family protein [Azorhizobium doebereinerae]|uniref:threonine/serine exporter family protein n=1 Tax=Azorhizobium doebereinerae TaxID=281091 RepID=UPI00041EA810|nr:threonine/serine exporter family protein [Azorhizobium doebereinerae]